MALAPLKTVYDDGPVLTPIPEPPASPPPSPDDAIPDRTSFKAAGKKSVAAFAADLQATRMNAYGFDSLLFDPHRTLPNRTETYYGRYRRYYDGNRWFNSHVNAITESLVEYGLDLATDDEAKKKTWADWRKATGFDALFADLLKTRYALGNAYAAIVPAAGIGIDDPDAHGIALQVLTSEYCYNVGDETGVLQAFYHSRETAGAWQTFDKQMMPTMSQGPWIMPEDMFYLSYDRLCNDLYARSLASTAGEAFDDMSVLSGIRLALAKRAAYDLLIFNVDTSHVSGKNDTTKGINPSEEYFNGVMDQVGETEQFDATTGKMTITNRIGFISRWDADKKVQQGKVEVQALGNNANFEGLVKVIDQLQRELSMVLRVPQAFMGSEGSNRAESVTQYLSYSQFLDAQIIAPYAEIESKLFPLIGLEGETLAHDSRVPSQELIEAQIADIVARTPQLRDDEKRPILERLFNVKLIGSAPPPLPAPAPFGQQPGGKSNLPGSPQDENAQREQAAASRETPIEKTKTPAFSRDEALVSRRLAKFAGPKPVQTPAEEAFRAKWDFKQTALLAKMRLAFDTLMMGMAEQFLSEAGAGKAKLAGPLPTPEELARLAKLKADKELFRTLLDDYDRLIYQDSSKQIAALANLPADFEFKDTKGLQRLLAVNELSADRAISDVGAQARQVLVDAVSSGKSIDEAADEVRQVFDDYDTDRLVRTELTRAGNAGTLDAYRNIPQYQMVRWMTSQDSLVDPICRNLEAQYSDGVSIDTAESLGIPPEHPNCRCRWVPVSEWKFVTGGA